MAYVDSVAKGQKISAEEEEDVVKVTQAKGCSFHPRIEVVAFCSSINVYTYFFFAPVPRLGFLCQEPRS